MIIAFFITFIYSDDWYVYLKYGIFINRIPRNFKKRKHLTRTKRIGGSKRRFRWCSSSHLRKWTLTFFISLSAIYISILPSISSWRLFIYCSYEIRLKAVELSDGWRAFHFAFASVRVIEFGATRFRKISSAMQAP